MVGRRRRLRVDLRRLHRPPPPPATATPGSSRIQCGNGGICADHVECNENGETGFVHDVYMDGTDVGDVCVPEDEVDEVNIAQLILREFKRISWPSSRLVVQPPGGKTLVNLETNFYTTDNKVVAQDVTDRQAAGDDRGRPDDVHLPLRRRDEHQHLEPRPALPRPRRHPHLRVDGCGRGEPGHHLQRSLQDRRRRLGRDPGDPHGGRARPRTSRSSRPSRSSSCSELQVELRSPDPRAGSTSDGDQRAARFPPTGRAARASGSTTAGER